MRITDELTAKLITEAIEWGIEESIQNTNNKQAHLNKLLNSRSCGVSFDVWKKKNADGKKVPFTTGNLYENTAVSPSREKK